MAADRQALQFRFAVFFDFLGASHAALNWPSKRVHEFVDLLISIAHIESSEDISGEAMEDGGYRIKVTPEVTTFADNIVVSYSAETDDRPHLLDSVWTDIVCKDAIRILGGVAELALRVGVLMRGGMVYGELYHQNGVVFGEALVRAVALEKSARVPRILVSEEIIAKLTHIRPDDSPALTQDADGQWCLNYISEMARQTAQDHPLDAASLLRWRSAHLTRVNAEIAEIRCSGDLEATKRAEKWEWFKQRFEEAAMHLDHLH